LLITLMVAPSPALAANHPVIQMPGPRLGILTHEEFPLVEKGVRLLYDGYYNEASKEFDRLRELLPQSPTGELGRVLRDAVRLREDPKNRRARQTLQEGIAAVEKKALALLEEDPNDPRGLFYVGTVHFFQAQVHRRRLAYWSAVKELRAARDLLEQVVNKRSDAWEAYVGLGGYNYFMDALPAYGKILRWLLFLPRGNRERGLEQLQMARNHSLLLGPVAQNILLVAYSTHEKTPGRAEGLALSLRREFPNNPWFHLNPGYLYLAIKGRSIEGVAIFEQVLERARFGHPNYTNEIMDRARLGLMFAYQRLGNGNSLRKVAEKLLENPPVRPKYVLPLTRLMLGEQLARDEQYKEARRLLTQVTEVEDWGRFDWRVRLLGFKGGKDIYRRAESALDELQRLLN
jgi:tetratricopeptide (TPR) repeat protein